MTSVTGFRKLSVLLFCFVFIALLQARSQSFIFNGDASSMGGNCYQLTPDLSNQLGTIWYSDQIDLNKSFDLKFDLYFGTKSSDGADGIVFVLQTVGSNAIGTNGVGIGFAGFSPSLGVEFDTFDNSSFGNGDDSEDHIAILRDGSTDHTSPQNLAGHVDALPPMFIWQTPGNIENGNYFHVRITWDPGTQVMKVYFDCELRITLTYDVINSIFGGNNNVYWGFTSATGGLFNEHRVCIETNTITQDSVYICEGGSATLLAAGAGPGGTYSWSPNSFIDNVTATNPVVNPPSDATYYVVSTDGCGITKTDSVKVFVDPPPVVDLGNDTSVCLGSGITLDAGNPGCTYAWSTGESTQTIVASPGAQTLYTVTVTTPIGCSNTDDIIVDVNSSLTVDAGIDQTICDGESAILTATGGTFYSWDTGQSTASITVQPSASTTYFVTATDAGGCSGTASVSVNVNASPTANAGGGGAICSGESFSLSASGGTSYLWDNGLGAGSVHSVSPSSTTVYNVTVTNAAGCSDTDAATVVVNNTPVADAGADISICGGSVNLLCTGGGTYLWNGGQTTASISVSPVITTQYTVTVTSADACTDIDTVVVTVNTSLTADAGSDVTICEGSSTTLSASGGSSYLWSTGATTNSITVNPAITSVYSVTVSDGGSCSDTDAVNVNVNPAPIVDAGTDEAVCDGESTTLSATGTGSFSWSGGGLQGVPFIPSVSGYYTVTLTDGNLCSAIDSLYITVNALPPASAGSDVSICAGPVSLNASGGILYLWSTGETTAGVSVNPVSTTTYWVTVADVNGCTATDDVIVTVDNVLLANAGSDADICPGTSANLTATGGANYLWSNGETTASISVSPSTTTTFSVTVSDGSGCSGTDDVIVNILPATVAEAGASQDICEGQPVSVSATGGINYTWSGGVTQSVPFIPASTGTYTVTVTDNNGCTAMDSVAINVHAYPNANAGQDVTTCGGSTVLTATGGNLYFWSTMETTPSITVGPAVSTDYYVTVSDMFGCTASDTVSVIVGSSLTATAGPDTDICEGESAQLNASGGINFNWSTGGTASSITVSPSATTVYSVTVSDGGGCTGTASATVTVNPIPSIIVGGDGIVCEGSAANLVASGANSYLWSNSQTGSTISVTPVASTSYTVTATDIAGCTATASIQVDVNPGPTANAGPDVVVCDGSAGVLLTASGGNVYQWSSGGASSSITVNPTTTTSYTVTVTDPDGCTDTDNVTVTIGGNIVPSAGNDVNICSGNSTTLIATGGASYAWSNGVNSASNTVSPIITTTYIVTVSDGSCSGTDTVVVFVDLPGMSPVSTISVLGQSCAGSGDAAIDLEITGGTAPFTYEWNTGDNTQDMVSVLAGTYTVTVTDANLCTDVESVVVVDPAGFNINAISSESGVICNGYNATISIQVDGGTAPYIYYWNGTDTTQSIVVNPVTTTSYFAQVEDANGCFSVIDTVIVATFGPINYEYQLSDSIVCPGEEIVISFGYSGGTGGPYFVSVDGESVIPPVEIVPDQTAYHIIRISDGCQSVVDSVELGLYNIPVLDIRANTYEGCQPLVVKFAEVSPFVNDFYMWEFGDFNTGISIQRNPEITFTNSGSYDVSLMVTTPDGCDTTVVIEDMITVYKNPVALFYPQPDETTIVDPEVQFVNLSLDYDMCVWDFGDFDGSVMTDPKHTYPAVPGDYDVMLAVSTYEGCIDTIWDVVSVMEENTFYAPSAFIPEGDDDNSKFRVFINGVDRSGFRLMVMDRWGEKVFETFNYDHAWDGRIKNRQLGQTGVYTWIVEYGYASEGRGAKHQRSGTVTLIR